MTISNEGDNSAESLYCGTRFNKPRGKNFTLSFRTERGISLRFEFRKKREIPRSARNDTNVAGSFFADCRTLCRLETTMSKSRRQFLTVFLARRCWARPRDAAASHKSAAESPPGAPPAFGTSPPAGPEVSPATFAEAEKLVQVNLTSAEREQAARTLASESWPQFTSGARVLEKLRWSRRWRPGRAGTRCCPAKSAARSATDLFLNCDRPRTIAGEG